MVAVDSKSVTGYVDGAAAGTNVFIVDFVILNIFYKKKSIGNGRWALGQPETWHSANWYSDILYFYM